MRRTAILEELIQQYVNHLRNERNVSGHTLRNYCSDLRQFQQFLIAKELCWDDAGAFDVGQVDLYVVRAYLASLSGTRKKSSIGRKLAALKGFFRYLLATQEIAKNSLLSIHSPK